MPLVKTSGVTSTVASKLKAAPGAAKKFVGENKYRLGAIGGAGLLAGGIAYRKRSKERAREDAIIDEIVNRNMQKQAFLMPFAKALFSGAKSLAGGVAKGAKAGLGGAAQSFENAGYKGIAKGINTFTADATKAGQWAAQRAGQLGGWAKQTGQQMGQRFANTNIGQKTMNVAKNAKGKVDQWFRPVNNAANGATNGVANAVSNVAGGGA